MTFLALMIVLAIDYFTSSAERIRANRWLASGVTKVYSLFKSRIFFKGHLALTIVLCLFAVVTALIYAILLSVFFKIFAFLFSITVLIFCLQGFAFQKSESIETLLSHAVSHLFSVVFWFLLLGPVGAVVYHVNEIIIRENYDDAVTSSAEVLRQVLDWLPVRLLTLSFALVGHFSSVIGFWLDHVFSGFGHNETMLMGSAQKVLAKETEKELASLEEKCGYVYRLLQRSLIVWLIVIALFVLL